jgi:hypothetical protein
MRDLLKICHLADARSCAFRKVSLKAGTGLSPLARPESAFRPGRHAITPGPGLSLLPALSAPLARSLLPAFRSCYQTTRDRRLGSGPQFIQNSS